eukprot:jgi/Ulvmu1/3602/UM017_0014.1
MSVDANYLPGRANYLPAVPAAGDGLLPSGASDTPRAVWRQAPSSPVYYLSKCERPLLLWANSTQICFSRALLPAAAVAYSFLPQLLGRRPLLSQMVRGLRARVASCTCVHEKWLLVVQVVNATVPAPLWLQLAASDPDFTSGPHATVFQLKPSPDSARARQLCNGVLPCSACCVGIAANMSQHCST